MSSWREIYSAAIWETNSVMLDKLIAETEIAIFHRWQELKDKSVTDGEHRAIRDAVSTLLKLKTEKLGWPEVISPKATNGDGDSLR